MRGWVGVTIVMLLAGCRYRPDVAPLRVETAESRLLAGNRDGARHGIESGLWPLVAPTTADTGGVPAALRYALSATSHPMMRWGDISDIRDALFQSYAMRSWRPLWSKDGRLTQPGRQVLAELDSARVRGLDPRDYDVARLDAGADSLPAFAVTAVAEFDVMLSVATARHAVALSHGRIDPHLLHPTLEVSRDSVDVAVVLEQLTGTQRPDTMLRNLEPRHATYQRLVDLLAQYRRLAGVGNSRLADSVPMRIRQIELALERWRWLPHSASAPWIVVNVPAFRLYALASGREEMGDMLRMNVVAGQSAQHPTPLLVTRIVAVQFHPPWLVPQSIASREIRPVALRDTAFLGRQHYELLHGDTVVAATRVNVLRIGAGIDVRQAPGPWNALGDIKFVTPNDADVYLHDTPTRRDFLRRQRDLSHGCIRVADPVALAEFALQGEPEWTPDRIADAWADPATRVVPLRQPIPVFVLYQTVVPRESGGILVYPDVYGYDKRLDAFLRAGYSHRIAPIS
jgi:murein L,D-transpeptidase YcbB/YkuD